MARAYQLLEQDGVIETMVGRGSFVIPVVEESRRLKALVADSLKQLWEAGGTLADLEAWCVSIIRALEARKD